jgi:hypothetical protein
MSEVSVPAAHAGWRAMLASLCRRRCFASVFLKAKAAPLSREGILQCPLPEQDSGHR